MADATASTAMVERGVYRVPLPVPFALQLVNVYLVDTGRGFVLVDTGVRTAESVAGLDAGLHHLGIDYRDIVSVVLTHFHPDHAGQAARVRKRSGAPIAIGGPDADLLAQMLPGGTAPPDDDLARHGVPSGTRAGFRQILAAAGSLAGPFAPDVVIDGAGPIESARPLRVVPTPGHTPGHLCVYLPDAGVLLGGDHVLPHITPHVGRFSPADPNPLAGYLASLRTVLGLGPRRILPAHGEPIEEPDRRVRELLDHHARRLDQTLGAAVPEGATAWDAARDLFGSGLDDVSVLLAFFEGLAHLEYLRFEGALRRDPAGDTHLYRPVT